MSIQKPNLIVPWASNPDPGDIITPSEPQQEAGFTPTIAAPPYQWVNWVMNALGKGVRYMMGRSISDYNGSEQYSKGDCVQAEGDPGTVYQCIETPPAPGHGLAESTYWEIFGTTWLPDALKTSLATKLPSLMLSALLTLMRVAVTGYATNGTIQFFGQQIAFNLVTYTTDNGYISGGFPISQPITWQIPFGTIYGTIATPLEGNTVISIQAQTVNGCNVTPQTLVSTNPANPLHVFVIAIGATP